jgi:predicted MarR family transcription regulator
MARGAKRAANESETDEVKAARALVHHSHLADSPTDDGFAEFEFALHHITEAFARWSSSLHEYVSGQSLPVHDVSVLQLIRMNERAKSAAEIGKFLNRDDSSNILYTLRKLEKSGLIEKTGGPLRQTTYQVTALGRQVTDNYALERQRILLHSVRKLAGTNEELSDVVQALWRVSGLYEQAAKTTVMLNMLRSKAPDKPAASPARKKPVAAAVKSAS